MCPVSFLSVSRIAHWPANLPGNAPDDDTKLRGSSRDLLFLVPRFSFFVLVFFVPSKFDIGYSIFDIRHAIPFFQIPNSPN
jgi:hypothetical protein